MLFTYSRACTRVSRDNSSRLRFQSADGSYQFRYEVKDPEGNSHFHEESSDASGARRGSFGIVHKDGQFVNTEYTADDNGYKPVIQSNVPGVSRGGR
ncbi:hypothetical protein V5799_014629 [Amblyomma americanum]|uniref:Cuticle protein n=1 Tax=Amblyomma americanum TaxID=6943 RepID=A0AAQ4E2G7_AMBAM